MFTAMEQWADLRRRVLIEGTSRRQILKEDRTMPSEAAAYGQADL
jgi:hypothetical protein